MDKRGSAVAPHKHRRLYVMMKMMIDDAMRFLRVGGATCSWSDCTTDDVTPSTTRISIQRLRPALCRHQQCFSTPRRRLITVAWSQCDRVRFLATTRPRIDRHVHDRVKGARLSAPFCAQKANPNMFFAPKLAKSEHIFNAQRPSLIPWLHHFPLKF